MFNYLYKYIIHIIKIVKIVKIHNKLHYCKKEETQKCGIQNFYVILRIFLFFTF